MSILANSPVKIIIGLVWQCQRYQPQRKLMKQMNSICDFFRLLTCGLKVYCKKIKSKTEVKHTHLHLKHQNVESEKIERKCVFGWSALKTWISKIWQGTLLRCYKPLRPETKIYRYMPSCPTYVFSYKTFWSEKKSIKVSSADYQHGLELKRDTQVTQKLYIHVVLYMLWRKVSTNKEIYSY